MYMIRAIHLIAFVGLMSLSGCNTNSIDTAVDAFCDCFQEPEEKDNDQIIDSESIADVMAINHEGMLKEKECVEAWKSKYATLLEEKLEGFKAALKAKNSNIYKKAIETGVFEE